MGTAGECELPLWCGPPLRVWWWANRISPGFECQCPAKKGLSWQSQCTGNVAGAWSFQFIHGLPGFYPLKLEKWVLDHFPVLQIVFDWSHRPLAWGICQLSCRLSNSRFQTQEQNRFPAWWKSIFLENMPKEKKGKWRSPRIRQKLLWQITNSLLRKEVTASYKQSILDLNLRTRSQWNHKQLLIPALHTSPYFLSFTAFEESWGTDKDHWYPV